MQEGIFKEIKIGKPYLTEDCESGMLCSDIDFITIDGGG